MTQLKKSDAAVVFAKDGSISFLFPKQPGGDLVPQHVLVCMALGAYISDCPEVIHTAIARFEAMAESCGIGHKIQ